MRVFNSCEYIQDGKLLPGCETYCREVASTRVTSVNNNSIISCISTSGNMKPKFENSFVVMYSDVIEKVTNKLFPELSLVIYRKTEFDWLEYMLCKSDRFIICYNILKNTRSGQSTRSALTIPMSSMLDYKNKAVALVSWLLIALRFECVDVQEKFITKLLPEDEINAKLASTLMYHVGQSYLQAWAEFAILSLYGLFDNDTNMQRSTGFITFALNYRNVMPSIESHIRRYQQ